MKKVMTLLLILFLVPIGVSANAMTDASRYEGAVCVADVCEIFADDGDEIFNAPIIGEFEARNVSLPILAIVMGAVDGFNPCAMWILIFLITMLFNIQDKKRRWILGFAFILTSGVVYLLLMVTWLNLALFLSRIRLIRLLISIFAIIFGMISIYKFVKQQNQETGCDVTSQQQKGKIMERVRKIVSQKSFASSLVGIIALAASVNILEALCSLGLPLIFTQVLAINELSTFEYGFYIGLYILFFVLDDILVFSIAMKTLSIKGISNKYTKYANLIGGIVMLLLGLLMTLRPEWLMFNF